MYEKGAMSGIIASGRDSIRAFVAPFWFVVSQAQ
jgi:hypothetical protein